MFAGCGSECVRLDLISQSSDARARPRSDDVGWLRISAHRPAAGGHVGGAVVEAAVPDCAAQLARYPASERPAGCPVAVLSCPIEHPSPGGFVCRTHSHTRSGVVTPVNETWGGEGGTLLEPAVRSYSNAWDGTGMGLHTAWPDANPTTCSARGNRGVPVVCVSSWGVPACDFHSP